MAEEKVEKFNKKIFLSKTFWMGLITAIVPMFPSAQEFVVANIASVSMVWGALAIVLRMVTKDKVVLID